MLDNIFRRMLLGLCFHGENTRVLPCRRHHSPVSPNTHDDDRQSETFRKGVHVKGGVLGGKYSATADDEGLEDVHLHWVVRGRLCRHEG